MGAYNFLKNFANMFYIGNNEAVINPEQFGEVGRMKATELAVDQSFFNMFEMSSYACFLFLVSGALGMGVNVSSCFVGGKASALAYAMLGLTKTITVIAIGVRISTRRRVTALFLEVYSPSPRLSPTLSLLRARSNIK